jgi:hypothetical protein
MDCSTCDFAADGDSWCNGELFVVDLMCVPAADVRPVVRAHWENTGSDTWKCSSCGYGIMPWNVGVNYCSNCGACMTEDKGDYKDV